jgi:hypothetical protein
MVSPMMFAYSVVTEILVYAEASRKTKLGKSWNTQLFFSV